MEPADNPIAGAQFDREVSIDATEIAPFVTWGTSPEDALPIDGSVPDPARERKIRNARNISRAPSTIWGWSPARSSPTWRSTGCSSAPAPMRALRICAPPRPCSLGRISKVPGLVSPGSSMRQATGRRRRPRPHLPRRRARMGGFRLLDVRRHQWRPGAAGERCASTTNRNFHGRQGPGARTHIMSPAMVAAAAVCGHLADIRSLPARKD